MPFKITTAVEERMRFIIEVQSQARSMTASCAAFGISRETGYRWLARYKAGGFDELVEHSRARLTQAAAMPSEIAEHILALRQSRPHWGPKKLRAVLVRQSPGVSWPAVSTMGDLLSRHGLVSSRRIRESALPQTRPFASVLAPNDQWCIDFKGWFRTRDGMRCDPLTITDAMSRYLLLCEIVAPTTEGVWPACQRLFAERGQPHSLRMDNGPPFGSKGAAGLTKLSVMWVKLGIVLEPITPGCPQENGRHERMHRTLKAETSTPPAASCSEQQVRFDHFRHEFNEVRPHEALGQQTPSQVHRTVGRPYTGRLEEPWYDADHTVHRVLGRGEIRWDGEMLYISEALAGECIGIATLPSGDSVARFANIDLGVIACGSKKFRRFSAPRTGRAEPTKTPKTVTHVTGQDCQ